MNDKDKSSSKREEKIINAIEAIPALTVDIAKEELSSIDPASIAPLIPKSIAPATTAEEDRHTASQRKVNQVWEFTQATIAVFMTVTVCIIMLLMVWRGEYSISLQFLSAAFFLIIGFYFGRTNHENVSGMTIPGVPTGYKGR